MSQRVVHALVGLAERDDAVDLDLRGQVAEHVVLRAAQEKGTDDGAQLRGHGALAVGHDGPFEPGLERARRPQDARVHERRERPELAEPVLDGGAGERDPHRGVQPIRGSRGGAVGVLDVLRFVEHDAPELDGRERLDVAAQERVRRDDDVALPDRRRVARGAVKEQDAQPRREARGLSDPVARDRRGADDEVRRAPFALFSPKKERERHDGLAEPHVVGQDAARAEGLQELEPGHAETLVRPERRAKALGQLWLGRHGERAEAPS